MNKAFIRLPEEISKEYRLSMYNVYLPEKRVVYNTYTGALSEFEDDELRLSDLDALIECGFIVRNDSDELAELKYEYDNRESLSDELHLIIATTLDCQLRCVYCYEEHPSVYMKDSVKNDIYRLVDRYASGGKNISVVWYGGEPLLDFESIKTMSEEFIKTCDRYGVSYSASMISNGYGLDDDKISKLKELHILSIQITIDGMKKIHESRRPMSDGSESFDRIISNVLHLYNDSDTEVHLRINVDKENISSAYELVDYCAQLGLKDIDLNLGMMKEFGCDHNCSGCSNRLYSMKEFGEEFVRFKDHLENKGFLHAIEKMQPEYKVNSCTLDAPDAYVIDPQGYVYKCISKVGQKEFSIGNVSDGFDNNAHRAVDPFSFKTCSDCRYFPICKGGCLMNNSSQNRECNIWRFITEDLINRISE